MQITKWNLKKSAENLPCLVAESVTECETENRIENPGNLAEMFQKTSGIADNCEEHLYMAAFNTKLKPVGVFEISHGGLDSSISDPKAIFQRALLSGAAAIALCHNHPSGDTTPSESDFETTNRIKNGCELLGIKLIDHLIMARVDSKYSHLNYEYNSIETGACGVW